jgi:CHAT domain
MNISGIQFHAFRTFAGSEPAARVAKDLLANVAPFAVFRYRFGARTGWRALRVDDELLTMLFAGKHKSAASVLSLSGQDTGPTIDVPSWDMVALESLWSTLGETGAPHLLLDNAGTVRGLTSGTPPTPGGGEPPPHEPVVYPRVECPDGPEIEPNQTVEFQVTIEGVPPVGSAPLLPIQFPEGAETLDLTAEISTADYAQPPETAWTKTFTIDHQLRSTPHEWAFKASARGDGPRYSLIVRFLAAGRPVGRVVQTLVRKGSRIPPTLESRPQQLPSEAGAQRQVTIAQHGADLYKFRLYERGAFVDESEPWALPGTEYFNKLETAVTTSAVTALGWSLFTNLPPSVRSFLGKAPGDGLTTLICSGERIAPFEIMRMKRTERWSFLGAETIVTRWTDDNIPNASQVPINQVVCIRPDYLSKPLPSALEEEESLRERFGQRLTRVATRAELEQTLARPDVHLIHFAGHSAGNPAQLSLADGKFASPADFDPSQPLVKDGQPFFFINGCQAGAGDDGGPALLSNMVALLLPAGLAGIVAPAIRVNSKAALRAMRTFYEVAQNAPVAEAVRAVRRLAIASDTPDEERATYLSYMAFVPSGLRLTGL